MPKSYREAYTTVPGGQDKKDRWVKIGVSFVNRDNSETVILNALPLDGKVILRTPKPKTSCQA